MIWRTSRVRVLLAIALLVGITAGASAQAAKESTINGQVKLGVHKYKLDPATLYQFEIKAKDFAPEAFLLGNVMSNTADFFKERDTFRGFFFPPMNKEYTLVVRPNIGFGVKEGMLDYTVTLKTVKLDETPILRTEDKLTADDPRYQPQAFRKAGFKAYPLKMTKGTTYIIDMIAAKTPGNKLNPFLYVENTAKNMLSQDDDSGGAPNARILFRPAMDGEYRIIASGQFEQSSVGDYTILVRTVKAEK